MKRGVQCLTAAPVNMAEQVTTGACASIGGGLQECEQKVAVILCM